MTSTALLIAAALTAVVGLIHSILGEVLIFTHLRDGGLVPTKGAPLLKERRVRILWASWHLVTFFGWAIAAILFALSVPLLGTALREFIIGTVIVVMTCSSGLVLYATKGMHPGWIGLLVVAVLCWLA